MDATQIRIRIDDNEELTALEKEVDKVAGADTEVVTEPQEPGEVDGAIAPIIAVLVGGVAAAWVSTIVWEWINKLRGGLVVDLREDAVDNFYRDRDLEYGTIVTFPADGGKVTIEFHDAPKSAVHQLLETFIDGTLENVKDIVAAAKAAVGTDNVTETGEEKPAAAV